MSNLKRGLCDSFCSIMILKRKNMIWLSYRLWFSFVYEPILDPLKSLKTCFITAQIQKMCKSINHYLPHLGCLRASNLVSSFKANTEKRNCSAQALWFETVISLGLENDNNCLKKFEKGTVFIRYWYCRIFVCCLDDQYLFSCCRNDKLDEEECQQIELIVFCTSRNVAKAAGEFLKDRLVMAADEEVKKASKSKRGKPWSGFL